MSGPAGHAWEYPDSFCECTAWMDGTELGRQAHLFDVTGDVGMLQLPTSGVKMATVPNKPKTPITNFRIPLDVKAAAQERAAERGETLTDVVVRALKRYARSK